MSLCDWLIGLLSSYNFTGTIVGALIGGIFAFLIARKQVESSENQQEKQRKEIVVHEHQMELIRIQLNECGKSIRFLTAFPDTMNNVELISYDVMVKQETDGDEALRIQREQVKLVTESMFKLLELESSAKICEMSTETIENCIDLQKQSNEVFSTTTLEGNQQLLKEIGDLEEYKIVKMERIEKTNELINSINESFRSRYEELVSKFRNSIN